MSQSLLQEVRGHSGVITQLQSAIEKGQLASTLLFVGPAGVGRKRVALGLLQALACEARAVDSAHACGVCGPCRRIASSQSESLLLIEPEKNSIKVEQAREVLDFVSLRGLGKARAIIVDSAHLMNPATSNALLKILEEPPVDTYFFLLAPSQKHVLPTIRSRAQVVRFAGLSVDDLRAVSADARTQPRWVLEAARGSLERLKSLTQESEQSARMLAISFLRSCARDDGFFLDPEWREFVKAREQAQLLAQHLLLVARDLCLLRAQEEMPEPQSLINEDQKSHLVDLLELWKSRQEELNQKILGLEPALARYRDPVLTFEELWISLNPH